MARTIPASDFGNISPENLGSVISKRASAILRYISEVSIRIRSSCQALPNYQTNKMI